MLQRSFCHPSRPGFLLCVGRGMGARPRLIYPATTSAVDVVMLMRYPPFRCSQARLPGGLPSFIPEPWSFDATTLRFRGLYPRCSQSLELFALPPESYVSL